jgi:hypothetical protein
MGRQSKGGVVSRFIQEALARAGFDEILPARARGDLGRVRELLLERPDVDLLVLGALADAVRTAECGDAVFVHDVAAPDVTWIEEAPSELELLRAVAHARIVGPTAVRIGVDWGRSGLELAQVALGFGATDLVGPITKKSGTLISEHELHKVKGKGMVAATALKRREIAALVRHAGRTCEFVSELGAPAGTTLDEAAHA